ncbi:hypothetical protein [Curtobacterium sp. MCBA15_001]|uniref:hypothetical protein n=1 Tax=Curtobacterium sp. MCBA15_001 TaxID=1898731 RepID=UPI000AF8D01F|nr:hypothetical protein [Curtobacterium sp. MCBA15_001]
MPENTPPLRFRTPPGWPTPSPQWVALHQGAEPAAGWRPSDELPPAPLRWVFWVPTRTLRRRVPRSVRVSLAVGVCLTIASAVVVGALAITDGPAVFGLVPLVVGIALWVTGAVRSADDVTALARSVREDAQLRREADLPALAREQHGSDPAAAMAAWDAEAWSVPTPRPFHEGPPSPLTARVNRAAVIITAGVATLVLVGGAAVSAAPAFETIAADPAWALGSPDAGDDTPQLEWSSDDDAITAYWLGTGDTWETTCDVTPGDTDCDAYEITSKQSCTAVVTVGFFADADADEPSRTQERSVRLRAGVPLVLVENYDEELSSIGDVTCADDAATDTVSATQESEDVTASDQPDGCDVGGCVAFAVTAATDCAAAAVEFHVEAAAGSVDGPHDLVVVTRLSAGKPTDVFAGGTDDAAKVRSGQVTCRAGADDGLSQNS